LVGRIAYLINNKYLNITTQTAQNIDLSIVLINYKTPHLLYDCIRSIYKETTIINFEIIVVDNNKDDNCEQTLNREFPHVRYVDMGYNSGFGRANNRGIDESGGKYILLLNDDTIILNNAIEKSLFFFIEEEKRINIGLLTCKFKNPDGSLQVSANIAFLSLEEFLRPNPFYIIFNRRRDKWEARRKQEIINHKITHEPAWLTGAFLLFNSKLGKEKIIRFDEDFLIYAEDEDICYRIKKLGYRTIYFCNAEIIHINSASYSAQRKSGQLIISRWLYVLKTKGYLAYLLLILLNYFNIICDDVLYLKNKIRGKVSALDIESYKDRKFLFKVSNKYILKILFKYRRKPSSSKTFLKYV
jgi:GT2 family glycosyltransferase